MPSVQSFGISFYSHMAVKSGRSNLAANSGSALKHSAMRLSCPGAFPVYRDLTAEMISSFSAGGAVLTLRSCSASWMSASAVGGGMFRNFTEVFCPANVYFCF